MPDLVLARRLAAEFVGTFALVFAGGGRDHGRREDPSARPSRGRDHLRARDHGDDLRGRAHLRGALQPSGHVLVRAQPALSLAARLCLLGRPDPRRAHRRGDPPRLARQHRPRRRHAPLRLPGSVVSLGARAQLLPDVRDHGRRHRHPRRRRSRRDRRRRHRRPRRDVRRPDLRCLDEPRPLDRAGPRQRRPPRALALHPRARDRRRPRRAHLPAHPRRTRDASHQREPPSWKRVPRDSRERSRPHELVSRIVIVGGSDAGISAALRIRELDPAQPRSRSSSKTPTRTSRSAESPTTSQETSPTGASSPTAASAISKPRACAAPGHRRPPNRRHPA